MKVCVAILSTRDANYDIFKSSLTESWVGGLVNSIPVYFYEGVGCAVEPYYFKDVTANTLRDGCTLKIDCCDDLKSTFIKTLCALDYIFSNYTCDVVFRTNLSSFIDIDGFESFINGRGTNDLDYAGIVGTSRFIRERIYSSTNSRMLRKLGAFDRFSSIINFASGAGFFISREKFELLKEFAYDFNFVDDVAIGYYLGIAGVRVGLEVPRFWVNPKGGGLEGSSFANFLRDGGFHYRFKSQDRSIDAELIRKFLDPKFRVEWCSNEV